MGEIEILIGGGQIESVEMEKVMLGKEEMGCERRWEREKREKCERKESEGFERGGRMREIGKE